MNRNRVWIGVGLGVLFAGISTMMAKNTKGGAAHPQDAVTEVGGEPVVTLTRPHTPHSARPQFVSATILPGYGMNLLKLKAYWPGKGEIDVISSPSLEEAKATLENPDDAFSNASFTMGAALLLPYPNRIRGKLSADGKSIETMIGGREISLPANWHGKNPGAEAHAMHGLIYGAKFQDVKVENGKAASSVTADLNAGDFGGHWPSQTEVHVETTLRDGALDIVVTAKNTGQENLPMAIGAHPYFAIPSGDRSQVTLHIPADERAIVNNYDDVFPTGQIVPVKGTPYDFTSPQGATIGALFMDESFTHLHRNAQGQAVVELVDPASKYGLRIIAVSPQIKAIQVYAPVDKNFVAVEPQFNLGDPYDTKIWGKRDTGIVTLKPGQSVSWHIRVELFIPGK